MLTNEVFIDEVNEVVDLANDILEEITGTTMAKVLQSHVDRVLSDIKHGDLESLFYTNLPILRRSVMDVGQYLAQEEL